MKISGAEPAPLRNARSASNKKGRRIVVILIVIGLVAAFGGAGVGTVGYWLVVADPLENAQAIVVLSGGVPFRAMEAASIYRNGRAPEVWITRAIRPSREAALAKLGIQFVRGETYNKQVLQKLGVPADAIRLLNKGVRNTEEEVQLIAQELKRAGGERVILVTSKAHTRRVKTIWNALVGDSAEAIVRHAKEDPFNPTRWWRNTKDALAVSREIFGMMNVWAGFPLRPKRQG